MTQLLHICHVININKINGGILLLEKILFGNNFVVVIYILKFLPNNNVTTYLYFEELEKHI